MSIRKIDADGLEARLEWLQGAAALELQQAASDPTQPQRLIEALDRVKQAAEQAAKHLRENPPH